MHLVTFTRLMNRYSVWIFCEMMFRYKQDRLRKGVSGMTCVSKRENSLPCVRQEKQSLVTVHSASLSSGEHVLSQGIYVVGIGWFR